MSRNIFEIFIRLIYSTFNIPNGTNRSLWGNTRSSNITSGLPNITGQINSSASNNAIARSVSGVFKNSTSVNTWCMGTEGTWQGNFYEHLICQIGAR